MREELIYRWRNGREDNSPLPGAQVRARSRPKIQRSMRDVLPSARHRANLVFGKPCDLRDIADGEITLKQLHSHIMYSFQLPALFGFVCNLFCNLLRNLICDLLRELLGYLFGDALGYFL